MFLRTVFGGLNSFITSNIFDTYPPYTTRVLSTSAKDFAIIGGGAAGMAAAIHARYDGFSTVVFDSRPIQGGGYSNTPLILNLPGYPTGISGASFSLGTIQQLEKLGGTYYAGTTIKRISKTASHFFLHDHHGRQHQASKIIIATGVAYRKLEIPGSSEFDGRGLYYEVDDSILEEVSRNRSHICIYGGGNSAGQAALFYESIGAQVSLVYRAADLASSMSQFLIQRISRLGILKISKTSITKLEGDSELSSISLEHTSGEKTKINVKHLFAMIGGIPSPAPALDFGKIEVDSRGYILVKGHTKDRTSFATSVPGIYAAGDITNIGAGRILLAQAQGVDAFREASRTDTV